MRVRIFFGLLLMFLAFWKGNGGYLDLREYLDDAERMWIKADLRLPGEPGAPPQYNRYSLGLPFLSGPFVWLGEIVERVTSGAISRRAVSALIVPVLSALAGVLLFDIVSMLNFSRRIAYCSSLVFCLGSTHLTYARFFYADAGIVFGVMLAFWSFLKGSQHLSEPKWLVLSGAGLAIAGACHYPHAPLVACVWFVLVGDIMFNAAPLSLRFRNAIMFGSAPALAALALVLVNVSRYHSLVPTGYHNDVSANISPRYIVGNLHHVAAMFARTLWFLPALVFGCVRLWRTSRLNRFIAAAMLAGVCAQMLFWLCFYQLNMFPIRYLYPMSALAALGLPFVLTALDTHFPGRGVVYFMIVALVSNALQFVGDTIFQPLFSAPEGKGSGVWFYTWYMNPLATTSTFDGGSPGGALQFVTVAALLIAGTGLLVNAFVIARKDSSG
ncbi:MAG: phospholipid carrier-dependent glycosyltransferase [Planctomycetota bacterium]